MSTTISSNKTKRVPKTAIRFNIKLSEEQKVAKERILHHPVSFIIGKAGSGKTLLACQIALDQYFKREVERIIITRPAVSTESIGFLPGSERDKMEPWLVPIRSNMRKVYNKPDKLIQLENEEAIELVSLSHFRGRTFDNAVVIIDEFQNLNKNQLAMCIGRLGPGSRMIFCGDYEQIDLPRGKDSAIHEISRLRPSKFVYEVVLTENHRHEALDDIIPRLNNDEY